MKIAVQIIFFSFHMIEHYTDIFEVMCAGGFHYLNFISRIVMEMSQSVLKNRNGLHEIENCLLE